LPATATSAVVLAGSCSEATRAQISNAVSDGMPAFHLDVEQLAKNGDHLKEATTWAMSQTQTPIVYASSAPDRIADIHQKLGQHKAGQLVEDALSQIAVSLRDDGVRRFVVAGGETSGAVVSALNIKALQIGPQIAPGVPWTASLDEDPIALALKSGNFGGARFFSDALGALK
ncbi:MAG: hypothetical protein JKY27_05355, partial [Magnetovibrio sp.]|nr:hypothetical protein [Magnetovibrio sp.]